MLSLHGLLLFSLFDIIYSSPSRSWFSALSESPRHEVFLIDCAPGEQGLGVVISADQGRGCVIKGITTKCPFASQVNIGDR